MALAALAAIMRDYLVEVGSSVKSSCEGQGRTEANLIDMLNACCEYGVGQNEITEHIQKGELSLAPIQAYYDVQERAENRIQGLQQPSGGVSNFKTKASLPASFSDVYLPAMSIATEARGQEPQHQTELDLNYERQRKVEAKRQTENAI